MRRDGLPNYLFEDRTVGASLDDFRRRILPPPKAEVAKLPCQAEGYEPCVVWAPESEHEPDYWDLAAWLNSHGEVWFDQIFILRVVFIPKGHGVGEIERERARNLSTRFGMDLSLVEWVRDLLTLRREREDRDHEMPSRFARSSTIIR